MELILWRHCEAAPGFPDAQRPLTEAGTLQARRLAAWLKPLLPQGALVMVSPALRAQQTAQALSPAFETNPAVGTAAVPEDILQAVAWPYGDGTTVVVGHQPTLGAAAALALTGRPGGSFAIPAGAIWWLSRSEQRRETLLRAVMTADLVRTPG